MNEPVQKEKKKLKVWQKLLIAVAAAIGSLLMAFILLVVALALHTSTGSSNRTTAKPTATSIEEQTLVFETGEDDFKEGVIRQTPVSLSADGLTSFEHYLSTVQPEYEFSDLYGIDEALAAYQANRITSVSHHPYDIRVNGKLDGAHLYELVKANNEAFFADKSNNRNMFDIPSDSEIRELCNWICEVLEQYQAAYPEIDMDMICCNLYDLKIASSKSTFSNGSVDRKNIFNYDKKQMDLNKPLMHTDDIYKTTFYHEVVHMCQICCNCYNREESDWIIGFNENLDDKRILPLCWLWLTEGSAERIMGGYLGVEDSTYRMYTGYLTSLNYIAQLDRNVGANEVERLNFRHDILAVFDLFDVQTPQEKEEFIKMMYSIEVLQKSPKAYYNAYKEKTGIDLANDEKAESDFRLAIKDDAILTMTKLFYRNLARQVQSGNTTLEDVQYLIRMWEAKLNYHTHSSIYSYMVKFKPLFEDYLKIQKAFYKLLAEENGVSYQELIDAQEDYCISIQQDGRKKSPNCELAFFDSDEKQFLQYCTGIYYSKGYPSIRASLKLEKQVEKEIAAYYETTAAVTETTSESTTR